MLRKKSTNSPREVGSAYNKCLKAGDIILFKKSKKFSFSHYGQFVVMAGGLISQQNAGHFDTVHAGICVGHDSDDRATISHISRSRNGYAIETLDEIFKREDEVRSFIVFRSVEPDFATILAVTALSKNANEIDCYSVIGSITTVFKTAQKRKNADKMHNEKTSFSAKNFCSKFVIEALQIAAQSEENMFCAYYPHIKSKASPKALEAHLVTTGKFEKLFYDPLISDTLELETECNEKLARSQRYGY